MSSWCIAIPESPSPNFILVKNISLYSTEEKVKNFFLFCGNIKDFEMIKDQDGKSQTALINFENESAAKTATLLSDAIIDDCSTVIIPYFDIPSAEKTKQSNQEGKSKALVAAEILANGYALQDQVIAKGIEYDKKYGITSFITEYFSGIQSNVKQIDEKYRIWDKAVEIDNKYKIQEKVQNIAQTAQNTANTARQMPTGKTVERIASQTLTQVSAVHLEAKKIQNEKMNAISTA
ncbi:hypothetical protein K501DRAFT_315488 [Backusella circina FSU 941]|nr:hypothetical protein K501DRAFT_315488 [Backusella circina FSU 941]